jgi:hypothetical protein
MGRILQPLQDAGVSGIFMTSGDGLTRRNHPLFACFIGDYPEQILVTCVSTGKCPSCAKLHAEFGEYNLDEVPGFRDIEKVLAALDSFDDDPGGFLQTCAEAGIKPIVDPFWKDLPYTHIYRSITPDILHQLYQGILKHVIGWVTAACGPEEIDARCRRMPPNHNVRNFLKGMTSLSRVTGQEHDQMSRILLGLVIDVQLDNGMSNGRLIRAVRALLDFLYIAQYPVHTDDTLELLEDALRSFHDNKDIFIGLGLWDSFNLPKPHFASHYVEYIKLYGSLDNFNTEYTERLHIDLAKDAYAATNHKDEFIQMTLWLERKEKIFRHHQYVQWQLEGSPALESVEWTPPGLELDRTLHMTKHPTLRSVPLLTLSTQYGATHFREALARFVALLNQPNLTHAQLERAIWGVRIPFNKLPVWHCIKYLRKDPVTQLSSTADSIHCQPEKLSPRGTIIAGRFDTALINDGTGEDVGIEGVSLLQIYFWQY